MSGRGTEAYHSSVTQVACTSNDYPDLISGHLFSQTHTQLTLAVRLAGAHMFQKDVCVSVDDYSACMNQVKTRLVST